MKPFTLVDIDELIAILAFPADSDEANILGVVRSRYSSDEDIAKTKSIKAEIIVPLVWPIADSSSQAIKAHVKDKKELFAEVKGRINDRCRDIFWENKNPHRIGIGRFNTLQALKQVKREESKKLKTEVDYLRTVLSEMAPDELVKVIGESTDETQAKIIKALTDKKDRGEVVDQEVMLKRDMDLLELDTRDWTKKHDSNADEKTPDTVQIANLIKMIEELNRKLLEMDLKAEDEDEDEKKDLMEIMEDLEKLLKQLIKREEEKEKKEVNEKQEDAKEAKEDEGKKEDEPKKIEIKSEESADVPDPDDMVDIEGKFFIDRSPVTVCKFKRFVSMTGYKTEAEKIGFVWIYRRTHSGVQILRKMGACWSNPDGNFKSESQEFRDSEHPVTCITYLDALEYAKWKGKRLPTEEEWLLAAFCRKQTKYPWGDDADLAKCNSLFSPHLSTSLVRSYDPNKSGLLDVIGNVWEWCDDGVDQKKIALGGAWNVRLEEMGRDLKLSLSPQMCNNAIGFRCVKG